MSSDEQQVNDVTEVETESRDLSEESEWFHSSDETQIGLSATLLLGSGVFCDEQLNERAQQRFASPSHVVNELEKPKVERQFLLGNAPMRAQPIAQQRPEPFHGVAMHFTKAVAIFISGKFASAMVDAFMVIAPPLEDEHRCGIHLSQHSAPLPASN